MFRCWSSEFWVKIKNIERWESKKWQKACILNEQLTLILIKLYCCAPEIGKYKNFKQPIDLHNQQEYENIFNFGFFSSSRKHSRSTHYNDKTTKSNLPFTITMQCCGKDSFDRITPYSKHWLSSRRTSRFSSLKIKHRP